MSLENPTHIDDFNINWPAQADDPTEGAEHIRDIKDVLKRDFVGITGAMTATHTELNSLAGAIADILTFCSAADTDAARQAIGFPALSGNGNKFTRINSGESALEAVDPEVIGITGEIRMWGGAAAPTGWLLCDGSQRTDGAAGGAALYAVIGITFGGTGTSDFNLPDFDGRVPVGVGTGDAADATAHTLGEKEGTETHTLTKAQIPAHVHTYNTFPGPAGGYDTGTGQTITLYNTGDGSADGLNDEAHNNLQPSLGINFIIKT